MNQDQRAAMEGIANAFERWLDREEILRSVELVVLRGPDEAIVLTETSSPHGITRWRLVHLRRKRYYRLNREVWFEDYKPDGGPLPFKLYDRRPAEEEIAKFISGARDMPRAVEIDYLDDRP